MFALGSIVAVAAVVFFLVVLWIVGIWIQNSNVNQVPIGRWTLYGQTADGGEVAVDVDIFANGTYQSNRGYAGRYDYSGGVLVLENWARIYFRERKGNAYVGYGTLNKIEVRVITLVPR